MSDIDTWTNDIHVGDARETLAELPADSVHMVMTSPPYFGLRDYGVDGQVGLEDSLDEYIAELVGVFREVRRVLRPDGAAWLNLGDTFGGDSIVRDEGDWKRPGDDGYEEDHTASYGDGRRGISDLGRKNKMLVPHRVAIALQDDGWVVRNDCTWVKPNPMPSSVKDRLNTTTEQVFYLRPQPDGWFDLDAIREPHAQSTQERASNDGGSGIVADVGGQPAHQGFREKDYSDQLHPAGKNPGDVFEVTTKPYPEAHFAVYPPELCEKPIKATCPPEVCADCGAPYEREVERTAATSQRDNWKQEGNEDQTFRNDTDRKGGWYDAEADFKGWTPTCDCETDATAPGIALDPFAGAGTTCRVAKDLGRRFIGIDLNPDYVAMAQKRVGVTVDEPDRLLRPPIA